jgi:hypothetical protein
MGGPQSRGFLLHPAQLPGPDEIVGAEALHRVLRGWLTRLGHPEPAAGASAGRIAAGGSGHTPPREIPDRL